MKRRNLLFCLGKLFLVASTYANTSVEQQESPVIEKVNVIYFGTYRLQEVFQADSYSYGSRSSPVLNNQFFLNYKISESQFFGLVLGFELYPFTSRRSYFYNPAFRIGDYELISSNRVRLSSDLRLFFPLNEEARNLQMIVGLASQNRFRWRPLDNRRFSFDSLLFLRLQFFGQSQSGRSFFLFDRAGLNYDFNSFIGGSLSTVMQIFRENRVNPQPFWADSARLGPGVFGKVGIFDWEAYLTFNLSEPRLSDGSLLAFLRAQLF